MPLVEVNDLKIYYEGRTAPLKAGRQRREFVHAVDGVSDRIAVMYLGKIVELAGTKELLAHLCHPYTKALFSAIPMLTQNEHSGRIILEGEIPSALRPPSGCRFHTRCAFRMAKCSEAEPTLREIGSGHLVSCYLY